MDKEKEGFPEESLPTEYLDALKKEKKGAEEELKDLTGDYRADMARSFSDRSEFLRKEEEQKREELKELSEDPRLAYEQAMNHGEAKKEDDDKDELVFDRHAGINFDDTKEKHEEKIGEDEIGKKDQEIEKGESLEESPEGKSKDVSSQEKDINKESEIVGSGETLQESKESVVPEKQIEEASRVLLSSYKKRGELLRQKRRRDDMSSNLAIKDGSDSQIDKEYEEADAKYQEALENVKNLTGKSEEEIIKDVKEYFFEEDDGAVLSDDEKASENAGNIENDHGRSIEGERAQENAGNIEKKLDDAEKSTEEREKEQSPEKISLSEKIVAGLKDKKVQSLLIKAVIVGGMIAIPVGGTVAAAAGMGLGQALGIGTFITYSTAAEGAAIGVSNMALGVAGGAWLSRLMRQARELIASEKSSEERGGNLPNTPTEESKKERIPSPEPEEIPQVGPVIEPVGETVSEEDIEWIPYVADVFAEEEPQEGTENVNDSQSSIELKEDEFSPVNNFDELYAKLEEMGSISASDGSIFSIEEMKKRIEFLRKKRRNDSFSDSIITKNGGLRGKVRELIDEEVARDRANPSSGGVLNWVG